MPAEEVAASSKRRIALYYGSSHPYGLGSRYLLKHARSHSNGASACSLRSREIRRVVHRFPILQPLAVHPGDPQLALDKLLKKKPTT
jgi:hypothetical protein